MLGEEVGEDGGCFGEDVGGYTEGGLARGWSGRVAGVVGLVEEGELEDGVAAFGYIKVLRRGVTSSRDVRLLRLTVPSRSVGLLGCSSEVRSGKLEQLRKISKLLDDAALPLEINYLESCQLGTMV